MHIKQARKKNFIYEFLALALSILLFKLAIVTKTASSVLIVLDP